MYQFPTPQDDSWMDLQVGDRVKVRYFNRIGTLILITPAGDYLVKFDGSDTTMAYDGDMLRKIPATQRDAKEGEK